MYGKTPLWQANLNTTDTLKTANYHYLHTDHLGTAQLATDSTGQVTWKAVSEAFGKTILEPTNKITMNLRFPGQYYDQETGTHYNYFRDYNPNIGRYNESDPIGLDGGVNSFGYVYNNPLKWQDSYGLETQVTCYGFACIITFPPPPVFPSRGNGFGSKNDPLSGLPYPPSSSSTFFNSQDIRNFCDAVLMSSGITGVIIHVSKTNKGFKGKQNVKDTGIMDQIRDLGLDPKDPKDHDKVCEFLNSLGKPGRSTAKALGCDGNRFGKK